MGFGKAGWYSYDLLDNLGRKSASEIVPRGKWSKANRSRWADRYCGDRSSREAFVHTVNATCSTSRHSSCEPTARNPPRQPGAGTAPLSGGRIVERFGLGPGDGIMVRKQLLELQKRTARRPVPVP